MSSQRMLAQQVDGLEVLKTLLMTDPKDIAAAHEEARKQMQLTETEEAKLAEARAYMAKYDQLSLNHARNQNALEEAQKSHAELADKFKEETKVEWQRINNSIAELNAKEAALAEKESQQAAERKRLEESRCSMAQAHQVALNFAQSKEREALKAKTDFENETHLLRTQRLNLKQKAALLSKQAAELQE